VNEPLPLPTGLVSSLEDQLDLVALRPGLPTLEVFENRAWLPTFAQLDAAAAEASDAAGAEVLVRADLSDSVPVFVGADQLDPTTDEVTAGVVHVGVPFDDAWSLSVDGTTIDARRAFGETTAYDVAAPGTGELRYDSSSIRLLAVLLQVALWLAAIFVAARVRVTVGRRESLLVSDETLIDLTDESVPTLVDPGLQLESGLPGPVGPDAAAGAEAEAEAQVGAGAEMEVEHDSAGPADPDVEPDVWREPEVPS